ncbi:hypothetical protein PTT_17195 [Pyrenophora teres f. teres 0-1]|uniref:Uncharacterized protein n=1 Tax=Pyrenophora teres f. teres (strain 0-1) TaxID=861557 RepID=E3S3V2_PYRTT|nr:hypothetical protein PTT_17214 [Pyrenophora teres f. teres 0-1]EFQ87331.1 hypothetical protein PTT_17195 [Pyrenophora teres f. teres 0-1]
MANIFASAYLTIAASGAENGNQGLWNRVEMTKFTKPYGSSNYTVCVRERFDHELHFEHDIYKTESWCELVRIYSGRNITFWQDRLPALSSLTNYFQNDAGRYLAGLREAQLPACLLWFTIHGRRAKPPNPSISSPPSWSWASIDSGIVDFEEQQPPDLEGWDKKEFWWIRSVTEVIESVVYPSTSDPRGMVSGGYITLAAPMLPLKSMVDYSVDSDGSDWRHEPHLIFQPGWAPQSNDGWLKDSLVFCNFDDMGSLLQTPKNKPFDGNVVFFVLRIIHSFVQTVESQKCHYEGLVLRQLTHLNEIQAKSMKARENEPTYARVGTGRMDIHKMDIEEVVEKLRQTITIL